MEASSKPKTYTLLDRNGQLYESQQPGTLGGNRQKKLYGRLDCRSAKKSLATGYEKVRVFFADEETAIAAGYRPCGTCMGKRYQQWLKGGEPGSVDYPWKVVPKQK